MLIAIATTSAYVCQAVIVVGSAGLKSCVSDGKYKDGSGFAPRLLSNYILTSRGKE